MIGVTEHCIYGSEHAIVGISQARSPQVLPGKQIEKIIVLRSHVAESREVMIRPYPVTKLHLGCPKGLLGRFRMVDSHKGELMGEVLAERSAAHHVEVLVSHRMPYQRASVQRRNDVETGRTAYRSHELQAQRREGGAVAVSSHVVGIKRIIDLQPYSTGGEILAVERL